MREGLVLQLGHHTGVVELLDVVDAGHAVDHLLVKLLQGFEVKVPKALVPAPCLIIPARGKTEGVRHLYMEHIKVVASPVHLGEKTAASIPDAQHTVLNLHPQAVLIQLPDADDGVLEGRDVVHPVRRRCSPFLALKMTEPTPLISTAEASPNLTEPFTPESRSKNLRRPVIWCVAPVLRYQPSILSSVAPLPRKAWVHGSSRWSSAELANPERGKLGPFTPSPVS
jgi:hypothetical protein